MTHNYWLGFTLVFSCWLCPAQSTPPPPANAAATPTAITIPAGTRVLMALTSPLHTTSATSGSGVYLATIYPIVASGRVVIPANSRVLGVVEQNRRPGRVKGRAQFRFRFNTLILPDNRVIPIAGIMQSLPGSGKNRTKGSKGTAEPVDQIDSDVYTIAAGACAGAFLGASLGFGGAAVGAAKGAGIGAGLGLAKVLFTRGDEIRLPTGTAVEMVLEQSLVIDGQ